MQCARFSILLTLGAALSATTLAARADGHWPPLNAIEERITNPVQVGNATFTTGYYSWYVPHYSVSSLHYSEAVNLGPHEWWMTIGLGGNEPIGPRTGSNQLPLSPATTDAAIAALPPVAPFPAGPGALAQLPAVASLPQTQNLKGLPSLPPLSP